MNPYFEQMILLASPVELVRLLYQRAIGSVREAREHLKNGRIEKRCASINNAYAVLLELSSSLRADVAPEDVAPDNVPSHSPASGRNDAIPNLTGQLRALYGYMLGRLVEANMHQTDEPLAEVGALLTTLAEAWISLPDSGMKVAGKRSAAGGPVRDGVDLCRVGVVSADRAMRAGVSA